MQNAVDNAGNDFPKGLAQPAIRALHGAGITKLEHLAQITESDLKKLHGMGSKAIEALRTTLVAKGLNFAES